MPSNIEILLNEISIEFEETSKQGQAMEKLLQAINTADSKADYQASYLYLQKLSEFLSKLKADDNSEIALFQSYVRALLVADKKVISKALSKFSDNHPYKLIAEEMSPNYNKKSSEIEYYILSIEYLTIMGDFVQIEEIPNSPFSSVDEIQSVLTKYFPAGKYNIHIINVNENSKEIIKMVVGKVEVLLVQESDIVLTES